jgi:hypothetical protein
MITFRGYVSFDLDRTFLSLIFYAMAYCWKRVIQLQVALRSGNFAPVLSVSMILLMQGAHDIGRFSSAIWMVYLYARSFDEIPLVEPLSRKAFEI